MPKLREKDPERRDIKKKKKCYRSYKKELREDFNKRCGYCDDHDCWAGGKIVKHKPAYWEDCGNFAVPVVNGVKLCWNDEKGCWMKFEEKYQKGK